MDTVRRARSGSIGKFSVSKTNGPCAIYKKTTKIGNVVFNLDTRYEIGEILGTGAYGTVIAVTDTTTGEKLAVKKIEKAFEHPTYTKRTLREMKIMRLMKNHENILSAQSIQLPKAREDFDEIYVIMELMETDLSTIIKSPQQLSDEHVQFFVYQILRGMKYFHSAKLLHRDLKPRNLLWNSECELKICDFGLAREDLPNLRVGNVKMTDYVATRWYRAPEALLATKQYTAAMDMWSIGCILGELLLRKPLLPGRDSREQLQLIFALIGYPSEEQIERIPNPRSRQKILDLPKKQFRTFDTLFSEQNPCAVDLLKSLLAFDPEERISVEQALQHEYVAQFHSPADEPQSGPVPRYDFLFEKQTLNVKALTDLMYEDILIHHFPEKQQEYEAAKKHFDETAPIDPEMESKIIEDLSESDSDEDQQISDT